VIHTEEEFDWNAPFNRGNISVTHMRHIDRVQSIFDAHGVTPTYVVDYPIVSQTEGFERLKAYADAGRAVIGAHLHPWVSPPFVEDVNEWNSFPGNLPSELEREKLLQLTDRIAEVFGSRPLVYLAGRYGFGPNTSAILEDLGYEVDVSTCVPMDFARQGGPDYSSCTNHPFWFGRSRPILGLPCTGAFVGWLPFGKKNVYRVLDSEKLKPLRLPGVTSRLRALDRLALTPEGYTLRELKLLTTALLRGRTRTFVLYFHSPSIHPGFTSYVRTQEDLKTFLHECDQFLRFFLNDLGGRSATPLEIRRMLEKLREV
jgi:hypothetical protein